MKQVADAEVESFLQRRRSYNKPIKPNAKSVINQQPRKDPISGLFVHRTMVGTHDINIQGSGLKQKRIDIEKAEQF